MYFGDKEKNEVTLPHSAQRKHAFWVKTKEISKTKKLPSRKKIDLELLHQILGHISTRLFMAGDTAIFLENIELGIDPYPFFTPCHISSIHKKAGSKIPLNPKAPFKRVFMHIIPSTSPNVLTSGTTFSD